ncbi:TRM11 family SAM-dependent methyltransferase [Kribbella soli]|nr:methyltransferase domain-containing protein [Kribbella soli]
MVMPCITDHLVLRTIDGAADLLVEELRAMASIHSIRQPSVDTVECTLDGSLDELAACGLYSTVAVRDLDQSLRTGALSSLPLPVRFRVGTADPAQRREMIDATEQRFGWVNRPGDWDVNLVPSAGGWIAEFGPLSWTRRFGRLERLPWSTNLIVAEVLVRLAKIQPGQRVVDPFCGTGTILLSVRRSHPTTRLLGLDHNATALTLATANSVGGSLSFVRGVAELLPIAGRSVDRVVANLPFGKQVGSHRANRTLYPAVLDEIDRVLTADGRAVLLTEDKRLLQGVIERQRALKVVRQRLLRYNGATPTAYVLARTRLSRTARLPRTARAR